MPILRLLNWGKKKIVGNKPRNIGKNAGKKRIVTKDEKEREIKRKIAEKKKWESDIRRLKGKIRKSEDAVRETKKEIQKLEKKMGKEKKGSIMQNELKKDMRRLRINLITSEGNVNLFSDLLEKHLEGEPNANS